MTRASGDFSSSPGGSVKTHRTGPWLVSPHVGVRAVQQHMNRVASTTPCLSAGPSTAEPCPPVVWRRVYSAGEQDLAQHRIYAPLDNPWSVDLMERADDGELEELLLAEWRAHIEPEDPARSIRAALDGVTKAKQLLDMEVAAAHAAGMSWADIGRVAGMTRQAARDRWGNP